jgi:hypothetical protein
MNLDGFKEGVEKTEIHPKLSKILVWSNVVEESIRALTHTCAAISLLFCDAPINSTINSRFLKQFVGSSFGYVLEGK